MSHLALTPWNILSTWFSEKNSSYTPCTCAYVATNGWLANVCLRVCLQVLALTQGQRFPLQTAEGLMDLLEQQHKHLHSASTPSFSTDAAAAAAAAAADEDASAEGSGDGELMEAPEQLLHMLSFTAALPDAGADSSTTDHAAESATAAATAAAHQRNHQQAVQQFGGVLKQVTNSPACGAAVWGLLGRWYALQGQHLSSQEARLKQVRAVRLGRGRDSSIDV
jgi:hypothetical protein